MAAERSGRPVDRIEAVRTEHACDAAVRPRFSALATSRGQLLRSLDSALSAYVEHRRDAAAGRDACVSL
jgi:hypothetical protein